MSLIFMSLSMMNRTKTCSSFLAFSYIHIRIWMCLVAEPNNEQSNVWLLVHIIPCGIRDCGLFLAPGTAAVHSSDVPRLRELYWVHNRHKSKKQIRNVKREIKKKRRTRRRKICVSKSLTDEVRGRERERARQKGDEQGLKLEERYEKGKRREKSEKSVKEEEEEWKKRKNEDSPEKKSEKEEKRWGRNEK